MDNTLFEQIGNISKAHGYDILAEQNKELKEVVWQLINVVGLREPKNENEKNIINKAKILSLK